MGRDAMGLLSLMIGLSECCNGLWCQDWRFMGPPPVVMSVRQPGGEIQRHYFTIISEKIHHNTYIYIYMHISLFHSCRAKCSSAYLWQGERERSGLVPS